MSSLPLKPTDAQEQSRHNATLYQASIQQKANSEPFWIKTFDDPITFFTFVLALTTICLFLSNLLLWLTTKKTVALMDRQTTVAEHQIALQSTQTAIASVQANIAKEQLLAQHRPKLVLKDVYFSSADSFAQVMVEFVNAGGGIACIDGGFAALEFVSDLRDFKYRPGRVLLDPLGKNGFASGHLRSFGIAVSEEIQRPLNFLKANPDEQSRRAQRIYNDAALVPRDDLYFFGIIYYKDSRQTGLDRYASVFRRRWNPETGGFERTGNPDHEYAD